MEFVEGELLRIRPDISGAMIEASGLSVRFIGLTCKFVSYKGGYSGDDRATIKVIGSKGLLNGRWFIAPHCLERVRKICMFSKEV